MVLLFMIGFIFLVCGAFTHTMILVILGIIAILAGLAAVAIPDFKRERRESKRYNDPRPKF